MMDGGRCGIVGQSRECGSGKNTSNKVALIPHVKSLEVTCRIKLAGLCFSLAAPQHNFVELWTFASHSPKS